MSAEKDTAPTLEIFTLKSNRKTAIEARKQAAEDADDKLSKRKDDNGGNTKCNQ